MNPREVVLVAGARTAMSRYGGPLRELSAQELGAVAARAAIERSGLEPAEFDHIIFGNALQTSGDAIYGARHVGLKAGLPKEVPAVTVNRLCGSDIILAGSGTNKKMETGCGASGGPETWPLHLV